MLLKVVFKEMFGNKNMFLCHIEDVASFYNGDRGKNYPSGKDFIKQGIPFINAGHLKNQIVDFMNMDYISEEKFNLLKAGKVQKDDILFCLRGSLGKFGIVNCEKGAIASSLVIIRANKEKIYPSFLANQLEQNSIKKQILSTNNGSSQPNLSAASVKKFLITVPKIEQQKQFIKIQIQVKKVQATLQVMLEKLELLKKAKFKEMFGNHVSTVMLGDCCEIHARIGWQALTQKEHMQSGQYMLVTGTDFVNNSVNYDTCVYISKERYEMDPNIILKNDDILVTKDGTIGKVAIVKNLSKPATLNSGIFVIRPDNRFDKEYIAAVFKGNLFSAFVDSVKTGATIKHLNQNKLVTFKIPVPSLKDQQAYSKILAQIEHTKQKLTKALSTLTDKN